MSSRALRKLQKAQDLEKYMALVREAEAAQAEEEDESDEEVVPLSTKRPLNAFEMLDEADNDQATEDDDEDEGPEVRKDTTATALTSSTPSKAKKKKKKAKKKDKGKAEQGSKSPENDMDEIDKALMELSTTGQDYTTAGGAAAEENAWLENTARLLAIDTKNLNPVNEMKSLFGNIAREASPSPRNQQRDTQQEGLDLATALSGKQCLGTKGKELGALAHRRNVFMQGREEWPGATSGGLSMEHEKDESRFEKKYNIMYNNFYQETQAMFMQCVQTMEPLNLIGLLRSKPYHIATLLQVSEIARVQGDHSVAGDLIERALFAFGRSAHSTFSVAVREGTARLSFFRPANREMYLSIWRYLRNLEQRGTWKTAFEWAKVLLQLDPARDPYGVTLMVDQLALRGRQHAAFIDMCSETAYGNTWKHLPNIQISLALAFQRNKQPAEARQALAVAIHKYPYILSELAKSLDIEPLPRSLWGKLPSTDAETLYTQLYVTRAKDLWNTPELTALLVEVAGTLDHYEKFIAASQLAPKLEISLEDARHIMLLEIPALIGLLPRQFTNMRTSMSDPLPPPDTTTPHDFTSRAPAGVDTSGVSLVGNIFGAAGGAAGGLLDRILGWWHSPATGSDREAGNTRDQQAAVAELAERLGVEPEEAQEILANYVFGQEDANAVPGAFDDDVLGGRRAMMIDRLMGQMENDEDSDDSLPGLESVPGTSTPPNPRAARVEDDEDEGDENVHSSTGGLSRGILRHVDSDDDDERPRIPNAVRGEIDPHPEPTHTIFASTSRQPTQPPVIEATDDIETTRDPQRIQRWLLSAGFESIKDGANMAKYVDRLMVLPKQQRDWTIRMVEQRGGKDLAGRVKAAVRD